MNSLRVCYFFQGVLLGYSPELSPRCYCHQELSLQIFGKSDVSFHGHFILFYFICILGPHWWHMEVPRPGVKSELRMLAYPTATATPDPSHVCDLHRSSWQCQILNPLREARDQTCILTETTEVHYP